MKLMILGEFESTGAVEMSVFHRLPEPWKGTNPFRLVSWPGAIPAQGACEYITLHRSRASVAAG